jgi:hypothetical protein
MSEIQGYAELIRRGRPDFIEIKGVTFTGGKRPEVWSVCVRVSSQAYEWNHARCVYVRVCVCVCVSSQAYEHNHARYVYVCVCVCACVI